MFRHIRLRKMDINTAEFQEAFKQFLLQNREVLPVKLPGKAKGTRNKPIAEVKPEELAQITLTKGQEKAIKKIRRGPRVYTEEQRAVMLKNLAEGRAKRLAMKEQGIPMGKVQKEKEEKIKNHEIIPVKPRVTKVKAESKPKVKPLPPVEDSESDSDELVSETEPEIRRARRRADKKKQVIDEIDRALETVSVPPKSKFAAILDARWGI